MQVDTASSSLFLADCVPIYDFCELICNQGTLPLPGLSCPRHIVVCERKEDLVAVRQQISLVLQNRGIENSVIGGIAMFTLDALSAALMTAWSSLPDNFNIAQLFSRPFLDVVTQESLVQTILLRLRFPSKESLSIAKQLLLLIDTPFPADVTLVDVLVGAEFKSKIKVNITHQALKQFLCAFQLSKELFAHFSRTQEFALESLPEMLHQIGSEQDGIKRQSILDLIPKKFIHSNLLWVEAPTYVSLQTYQPGNFQPAVSQSLKNGLLKCRSQSSAYNKEFSAQNLVAQFKLRSRYNLDLSSAEARVVSPQRKLWNLAQTQHKEDKSTLMILGDFELPTKESIYNSAEITHIPLHSEEILSFSTSKAAEGITQSKNDSIAELCLVVEDNCKLINDCIKDPTEFTKAYGLDWLDPEVHEAHCTELYLAVCFQETWAEGQRTELTTIPKALSLLTGLVKPNAIAIVGKPHSSKSPSFNVKLLNDAIGRLMRQGVDVELPASDLSYAGFYGWLLSLNLPTVFYVDSIEQIEEFPGYISRKSGLKVTQNVIEPNWKTNLYELSSTAQFSEVTITETNGALQIKDKNWWKRLNLNNTFPTIAATQFEQFVKCPFKFYLEYICNLKTESHSLLEPEPLASGTAVHSMAESFIHLIKCIRDHSNYDQVLIFLKVFQAALDNPNLIVHEDEAGWQKAVLLCIETLSIANIETVKILATDFVKLIYLSPEDTKKQTLGQRASKEAQHLSDKLKSHLVRRTLLRLVDTELKKLITSLPAEFVAGALGGHLEKEFSISLNGSCKEKKVQIKGKWDRIDFFSKDGTVFANIIDYKSSFIPKKEKELCFFPAQFKDFTKSRLCVQGALYVLAWEKQTDAPPCKTFTLYRLKSLDMESDPFLTYTIADSLSEANFETDFDNQYGECVDNLYNGDFKTEPFHVSECGTCLAQSFCPMISASTDGSTEEVSK